MAELKTKKTTLSVEDFIKKIPEPQKQKDAFTIITLMEKAIKAKATMWALLLLVLATAASRISKAAREFMVAARFELIFTGFLVLGGDRIIFRDTSWHWVSDQSANHLFERNCLPAIRLCFCSW